MLGAVVLNPRAPRALALRLVASLYWRDLADVAATPRVDGAVRAAPRRSSRTSSRSCASASGSRWRDSPRPPSCGRCWPTRSPRVLETALRNPRLREEDVVLAVRRPTASRALLEAVAASSRWQESYAVRLALVLQPRTPLGLALGRITHAAAAGPAARGRERRDSARWSAPRPCASRRAKAAEPLGLTGLAPASIESNRTGCRPGSRGKETATRPDERVMASFGENLRRERELRGIDLREIAEATKISIRFLQALEQDRLDILPGGLFPRAFVRQYAKHLGLDAERLVAEFVYAQSGDGPTEPAPMPAPRSGRIQLLGMLGRGCPRRRAMLALRMQTRRADRSRRSRRLAVAPSPIRARRSRLSPSGLGAGLGLRLGRRAWS